MDNTFTSAARNYTTTENGHVAVKSTGSAVLDLYGQIGALRGMDFDTRVRPLIDRALAEDPLLTMKTIFYGRDARGGTGERQLFRDIIAYLANKCPWYLSKNIPLIPYYGRWDDLYALVGTPTELEAVKAIVEQCNADMEALRAGKPVSLLGKWLKSCNTSSAESRKLGQWTRERLHLTERGYRKALSALREKIRIVERDMSANKWDNINYETLPSRAGMIYRCAFNRHDGERYAEYLKNVSAGKAKMHAAMNTPQDIIHAYLETNGIDDTLELMWKNLPDYVNTDENIMVMADVSGSMWGRPMEVSVGLAVYFAQHNKGAFHNLFMTFESNPRFITLNDKVSLLRNLKETCNAPWGGSTDLNKACRAMLEFAIANEVPDEDMPRRLIIISDMEIDQATGHYNAGRYVPQDLHIAELTRMYREAGYTMPQVIYWNVEARDNHFQTKSDKKGVMLASGSSPAIFEAIIAMKDMEVTLYNAMLEVLNGERYAAITI